MIFFARSYLIRTDSRLHRYFRALEQEGIAWHALAWDRTGVEPDAPHCTFYRRASPIGGGMRNLLRILAWNLACFRMLFARRREVTWVHAVDLDSALGAFVFARLFGKRFIFDAFDKYSDTRNMPRFLTRVSDALETGIMRRAERTILPDPCRVEQHGVAGFPNLLMVENVPGDTAETRRARAREDDGQGPLTLAYVGTLEPVHRGLEDLMAVVVALGGTVRLIIAGTGPLDALCREMAERHPFIVFHGQVVPDEGLRLMAAADVVVGMYYRSSRNHLFAAPNKYFEHLMLGRPLITTTGTPPGIKVEAHDTGWALTEGADALRALLGSLTRAQAHAVGVRAAALWQSRYETYFEDVMVGEYARLVAPASARQHARSA